MANKKKELKEKELEGVSGGVPLLAKKRKGTKDLLEVKTVKKVEKDIVENKSVVTKGGKKTKAIN